MTSANDPKTALKVRYPRTPYWPWSPTIGRGDVVHANPDRFGRRRRGGDGEARRRQHASPCRQGLRAQRCRAVRRQVDGDGEKAPRLEGERAGRVPVRRGHLRGAQHRLRARGGARDLPRLLTPQPRRSVCGLRRTRGVREATGDPVVPVLFRGRFRSVAEISAFMKQAHGEASALGGEREGVVLRLARGFPLEDFADNVCKSVRYGHVQTDEHWTRNWRACRIAGVADERYTGRESRVPRGGRRAHPPEVSSLGASWRPRGPRSCRDRSEPTLGRPRARLPHPEAHAVGRSLLPPHNISRSLTLPRVLKMAKMIPPYCDGDARVRRSASSGI